MLKSQLNLFEDNVPQLPQEPEPDDEKIRIIKEIEDIMGRSALELLVEVPEIYSIRKLKYFRDWYRAYKKGGLHQVSREGLDVGSKKEKLSDNN
ncbi:hypothetical protein LCGC14_0537150 [marine sediment metagenome]|uniref:Uncharacterized protein n=1 Tax=marine sediment metagenome TaxID=412755 RepID=A0A0F9RU29_9ZZZZ